ncbi:MAG TPA: PKD domain-containing protein, partial [Bacteroidales bacterium]|nr:PKD domain-containing protein [Bacteroidales bacterium]
MKKIILIAWCFSCFAALTMAQDITDLRKQEEESQKNPYITRVFTDENGNEIVEIIVPGKPPEDFRAPVAVLPDPDNKSANVLVEVPAYDWSFGCSATSAAMIAAYYDRTGYENIYTGPTNGGVMPMNNSYWPAVVINGETRKQCPLSATHQGLDGRTEKGHVDDYWFMYGSEEDPYYGNWTQHEYGDCTADYMGTNQFYNWQKSDGATTFFFNSSGAPVYDYTGYEPDLRDGSHGFREFIESRGYDIQSGGNYNQYIYGYEGNNLGFTWDQFKAEIDAGRPVMIQIMGHSMVGFGYDDSGSDQIVYIHDTWDYNDHTMIWGGEYSGMQHYGISIFHLEGNLPVAYDPPLNFEVDQFGFATWDAPVLFSFLDDFESYNAGEYLTVQSENWITWGGVPGSSDDAYVVMEQASSGTKSVKIQGNSDVLHEFGNLTTGHYQLETDINVNPGFGAYFNVLHLFGENTEWGFEAFFSADGTGYMVAAGDNTKTFNYTTGQWTHCLLDINLNDDWAIFYMNGSEVHAWQWSRDAFTGNPGTNQLAAIDFYSNAPYGQTPMYYFDDVALTEIGLSDVLTFYNLYLDGLQTASTTTTHYQFTGLTMGQTYSAGVSAVYDGGESSVVEAQFTYPVTIDSYALNFDGTNDLAQFEGFTFPTGDLTMEVWIRPEMFNEISEIICGVNPNDGTAFQLRLSSDGSLLYGENPPWNYMVTDPCIEINKWQHVAIVKESGDSYIYVNGELKVFGTVNEAITPSLLSIGGRIWNLDRFFCGDIDEVRIWSVARTQTELAENMDNYLTGSETGLMGYWKMNEGSEQTAYDETSNNYNFQLGTSSLADVNDPEWIPTDWPYGLFADFTADVTSGNAPLTVQFTDLSSSQATSWEWDFENDGTIDSYDQNPEWTYDEIGEYTVSLTVSGSAGSDSEIKANYISVNMLSIYSIQYTTVPGADNTYPSPYNGQVITTTGIVTAKGYNGQPNNFFISEPDAGPWKGIYVYNAGTGVDVGQEVILTGTISEYFGWTEINSPSVIVVSSGNPIPEPLTVSTGTMNNTADGEPYEGCIVKVEEVEVTQMPNAAYEWYVSDGSGDCQIDDRIYYFDPIAGQTFFYIAGAVDYSYDEYGINPRNGADIEPYVELIAEFSANITSGNVPLLVQFTDLSTGNPSSWEWDFDNDGTIDSYDQNPEFTYTIPGTYSVLLTVSDGMNSDTELKADFITVISNLNVNFTWDNGMGPAPHTVQFTDLSSGNPVWWEWDFESDGIVDSYEQNPQFTYETPGTYSIILTIGDGYSTAWQVIGYIQVLEPLEANFSADVT